MARRRMFSLDVVDSDLFQEMSQTARYLYFELGMRADDYGFVANPNTILRMIGVGNDDLKILIAKGFAIQFSNGILVISDWQVNNQISPQKRQPTIHQKELAQLQVIPRRRYELQPKDKVSMISQVGNADTDIINNDTSDIKQKNSKVKTTEMLKICKLLSSVGISMQKPKGKEIATKYTLDEIQAGINYANNHLPRNCANLAGWIITCLEQHNYNNKAEEHKCSKCKGSGIIINYVESKDDIGYCKMQEIVSDCPDCKGTGQI